MPTCRRCGTTNDFGGPCTACGAPVGDRLAIAAFGHVLGSFLLGIIAALVILSAVLIVAASLDFNLAALGIATVLAVVPAMVYALLVLRLDRYEVEPRRTLLLAFGWGAAAAVLLATLLEAVAGTVLLFSVGEDAAEVLTSVIAAPLIEESCKALALLGLYWFVREEFDNVLDGLVYGALIGLGFAMTENVLYLGTEFLHGGARAVGELFVVRVVIDGFGHAVYTAIIGASLGWARERYAQGIGRLIVPVIGWFVAVLLHMMWNGGVLIIGGLQGQDVSLIRVALIQAPLFTLLPMLVLWVIARVAARRELAVMREQLAPEVMRGVLTPGEYQTLIDNHRRREAIHAAQATGGRQRVLLQRAFFHAAAELAFRKYHLSRGERPKPNQRREDDTYRAELARLRASLVQSPPGPGH